MGKQDQQPGSVKTHKTLGFLGYWCFVLTTPNEIFAHTLHFVSWLRIHHVY